MKRPECTTPEQYVKLFTLYPERMRHEVSKFTLRWNEPELNDRILDMRWAALYAEEKETIIAEWVALRLRGEL